VTQLVLDPKADRVETALAVWDCSLDPVPCLSTLQEVPVRHAQSAPSTERSAFLRVAFAILLSVVLVLGLALLTAGLARTGITG